MDVAPSIFKRGQSGFGGFGEVDYSRGLRCWFNLASDGERRNIRGMILIGLGSNLAAPAYGSPVETCEAALAALAAAGVRIVQRSRWYESAPQPPSDQPWFVNGVVAVETEQTPEALLALCLRIEHVFGRERRQRNAARTLDLDLLAWDDQVLDMAGLAIPHPRLQARAFVLLPLAEIAPDWRHPALGLPVAEMIRRLGKDSQAFPLKNKGDKAPEAPHPPSS